VLSLLRLRAPCSTLFPYTTLFRSDALLDAHGVPRQIEVDDGAGPLPVVAFAAHVGADEHPAPAGYVLHGFGPPGSVLASMDDARSEEHTSELQSRENLVCRLLLEK